MTDGALKAGWRRVRLGDVVQLSTGRVSDPAAAGIERYVGLEHIEPGELRIRRWGLVGDGTTFTTRVRPGQVLFGKRRAYQRKVAVADFDGVCSGDIYVLEPSDGALIPELLPFICQSNAFFEHAVGTSAGSLSPRTRWESLASFEFVLPPVAEQRQMAAVLEAAATLAEARRNTHDMLGRLRLAAIDDLVGSTAGSTERITVGDVCTMQNGRPFPGSDYRDEGVRLLRPGNLGIAGYLTWDDSKTVCLDPEWQSVAADFIVDEGDVVINLTAQSLEDGFMGRVCLARSGDRSLLNQRIGRFRCSDRIEPEYLFRVLQTPRFRRHAEAMCEGSKVKHLFWSHIQRFGFDLPSLDSQRVIIQQLRTVDASLASAEQQQSSDARLASFLRESLLVGTGA
jgi:type I restriction enzyme, S subunit